MATARFQLVNPVRPVGAMAPMRTAAWRLIGGNNRDLGCSARGFESVEASREAVLLLKARIADAVPLITIEPRSSEWTWRLEIDGTVVARSVRGYLRHRECLYNVSHFLGCVPVAALPREPDGRNAGPVALLAAEAPAATALVAAILAIEAVRAETSLLAPDPASPASSDPAGEPAAAAHNATTAAAAAAVTSDLAPEPAEAALPEPPGDARGSGRGLGGCLDYPQPPARAAAVPCDLAGSAR